MTACTGCGEDKEPEAFGFRDRASGRRHRRCKACVAAYGRGHYDRNRQAYIARTAAARPSRARQLKERVWRYIAGLQCVDCGIADPVVLDFDHVQSSQKRSVIYRLVQSRYGWRTISSEIDKCQVRCANCHRRRTSVQFSWITPVDDTIESPPRVRLRLKAQPRLSPAAPFSASVPPGSRWCRSCGQAKALAEFYRPKSFMCVDCFRAYRRAHYRLNRGAYVERNVRLLRARRRGLMRQLWAFLTEHPCLDCGEDDPRVLEFDHRDPNAKVEAVTLLAHRGSAWARIETEVEKCDVRCANCHRRRTALQFDWPKLRISTG